MSTNGTYISSQDFARQQKDYLRGGYDLGLGAVVGSTFNDSTQLDGIDSNGNPIPASPPKTHSENLERRQGEQDLGLRRDGTRSFGELRRVDEVGRDGEGRLRDLIRQDEGKGGVVHVSARRLLEVERWN